MSEQGLFVINRHLFKYGKESFFAQSAPAMINWYGSLKYNVLNVTINEYRIL